MKKWMITSLLVLFMISVTSLSYAWFTYVQRKSVVKLTSSEIEAILHLDDTLVESSLSLVGLSYISFEKELMEQTTSYGTNEVGLNYVFDIHVQSNSPALKVSLVLSDIYPELMMLVIDEGFLSESSELTTDYHGYLQDIKGDALTKEAFLYQIDEHNELILDQLSHIVILPGETYRLQLIFWADYDALSDSSDYQNRSYDLELSMELISGKGDFND